MKILHSLYCLIDVIPEFPYFLMALFFVFGEDISRARHVLAVLFIYVFLGILSGMLVKYLTKSERPKQHYKISIISYDVPSLHTLISVGLVSFTYFIDPKYAVALVPVGIIYMQSRVSLGYHTRKAVLVGAAMGAAVGFMTGYLLWKITLPEPVEVLFVVLVLSTPLFATYLRVVNYRRFKACRSK